MTQHPSMGGALDFCKKVLASLSRLRQLLGDMAIA